MNAAVQFLGKDQREICRIAQKTFEGHQRAIIGTLTIEELYRDRQAFNATVREVAGTDVGSLGLQIASFTIKGVEDNEGYLKALGRRRIAEVKRDAKIGEALAERDAGIREAMARQHGMDAYYLAETEIAQSAKDYNVKQSEYDLEVNAEKAKAGLAGELASDIVKQKITEEEMQIQVITRNKEIEIMEQEILRQEKILEANVKKPSEAEKYRIEVLAEANKTVITKEAEGESESIGLIGNAEASVITIQGEAEAQTMKLKADAWKSYSEGAYMEMLISKVPEIARAIVEPIKKCEDVTMISTGDGEVGPSKLTGEVLQVMEQLPAMLKSMTGVDLQSKMKSSRQLK